MQALSRREENEVMEIAKAEASAKCREPIKAFADCCTGRSFSMAWACKDQLKGMKDCMRSAVPEARIDELKRDYIHHRDERKEQSMEAYKKERIESMKRHAGLKDTPQIGTAPAAPATPVPAPVADTTWDITGEPVASAPRSAGFGRAPVWEQESTGAGYGR